MMNIRNGARCAALALGVLLHGPMLQAQSVEDFRQVMTVHQQGSNGLQRVTLPAQVFEGSARTELGDLRVFNAKGEKVPFAHAALAPASESVAERQLLNLFPQYKAAQTQQTAGGFSLQVRQQADGTLVSLTQAPVQPAASARAVESYIVDASKLRSPITALVFDWEPTAETRSGRVRIETSSDLRQWQTLIGDAPLVDLEHEGQRLERKRVEFAATEARYLRLSWNGQAFNLRSLAAELPAARKAPPRMSKRVQGVLGIEKGEVLFDLGGMPPVEYVSLKLPDANSVAPVQLQARAKAADPWQPVASATFYRMQRDGAEIESPALGVAPVQRRYWRVLLDARAGTLGQTLPQLEVEWHPRSIIFVARGEGPYRVAWGNAEAKPEDLNQAQIIPGYKSFSEYSLPEARAEAVVAQTVVEPSAPEKALREVTRNITAKQVALWLILLGGVAVLGYMAWQLSRQMKKESGGEKSSPAAGSTTNSGKVG